MPNHEQQHTHCSLKSWYRKVKTIDYSPRKGMMSPPASLHIIAHKLSLHWHESEEDALCLFYTDHLLCLCPWIWSPFPEWLPGYPHAKPLTALCCHRPIKPSETLLLCLICSWVSAHRLLHTVKKPKTNNTYNLNVTLQMMTTQWTHFWIPTIAPVNRGRTVFMLARLLFVFFVEALIARQYMKWQ